MAAAVAAFAPEAIYYSSEARPYTLTALLTCLTVGGYISGVTGGGGAAALAVFSVSATLALYTHYTSLLLLGALAAVTALLWAAGLPGRRATGALLATMVPFLCFLPSLTTFRTHLATGTPWSTPLPLPDRPRLLIENLQYILPLPPTGAEYGPYRAAGALLVLIAALAAGWRISRAADRAARPPGPLPPPGFVIAAGAFACVVVALAGLSYSRRYVFPFASLAWVVGSWLILTFADDLRQWSSRATGLRVPHAAVPVLVASLLLPSLQYARARVPTPKSGIRALAADLATEDHDRTVYLVSPDVYASTLGFYMAGTGAELHGVPTWSSPERFRPIGYLEAWQAPTLVTGTMSRVQDKAIRGYRRLVLVYPTGVIADVGRLPTSRMEAVLSAFRRTYPLVRTRVYEGSLESVVVYVFALDSSIHVPTSSAMRF